MLPLGDMGPVNPMATLLIAFGLNNINLQAAILQTDERLPSASLRVTGISTPPRERPCSERYC
jgi:hypothetical protein